MPKMIQIRHVPDALHLRLKQRAARAGMSLSDYLKRELARTAARPSWDDALTALSKLRPIPDGPSSVQLVHEARVERDAELSARLGIPPE